MQVLVTALFGVVIVCGLATLSLEVAARIQRYVAIRKCEKMIRDWQSSTKTAAATNLDPPEKSTK